MRSLSTLIALLLIGLGSAVTQALADEVVYFSKEKVAKAMTKAGVMTAGSDHLVIMSRRDWPGEPEVHRDETDIFYVMEGSATFVTGGTVTDGRSTGPGQIRGSGIHGGQSHTLSKGDVIVIPKGTPHWFKEVPELVVYFVVKAVTLHVPPAAEQIESAVLAGPEEQRGDATVLGYDAQGALVTLRKGGGDLICLADDPRKGGFNAACYHKDLEPFMARGRELSTQGLKGRERHEARWKEIDDGKLSMPGGGRTLYVLSGKSFDAASVAVTDPYLRWVVYIPNATPQSTGLSTEPGTAPWLMFPGTPGAHIMISPPKRRIAAP
jgi:mannose-6-phosphate isomerase-like protein (cupin superfamily)